MTWPFENNTNGIVKNLAKRNLKSEKRRNIMVIISVVLAAFLISLSGLVGVSLMQTEKKKVIDTYEATYVQVDVKTGTGICTCGRILYVREGIFYTGI